jgi:hypothetical protein
MMIALSRFGMGRGKGGTSVQNLLSNALGPLQMTQHLQAGKAGLLGAGTKARPGLDVLDAHGKSRFFTDKGGDLFGFLDKLAEFERKHGSIAAQNTFEGAFGKQGTRIASVLADPVMIRQFAQHRRRDEEAEDAGPGCPGSLHLRHREVRREAGVVGLPVAHDRSRRHRPSRRDQGIP